MTPKKCITIAFTADRAALPLFHMLVQFEYFQLFKVCRIILPGGYVTKRTKNAIINPLNLNMKELKMAEAKGLMKPVKLKNELAELLGATELPRTEITKKLWDYIKANKLQTKTENGKPENAGKFIVADASLLPIFKNTKSKSKSGKVTDLTNLKEGQTINMMQMAAVVGANIE